MEAGKRLISDIFNRSRTLEIPFFQRAYVWEKESWERFLNDMRMTAETRRPYFLGSVIQKQRSTSSGASVGDVRAIVDGQQRLTTLTLFFKALLDERGQGHTFGTTFRTYRDKLILQHNHSDVEVFEAILEDRSVDLPEHFKDHKVLMAYQYFVEQRELLSEIDPITLHELVYFVGIDLGADEDEQQIFDTINSLGVALGTAELLKNELFKREDRGLYTRTWKAAFEQDDEVRKYWSHNVTAGRSRREMIDLFLQCFLTIQPDVGEELRVDRLFEEYKGHIKSRDGGREAFIDDLAQSANQFRQRIKLDVLTREVDVRSAIDRLSVVLFGLNTTTPFPYVLYVLKTVQNPIEQDRMLRLVETYLIRRLVCQETPKNYNKVFAGFIRGGLNTHEALADRISSASDPGIRLPSDPMFQDAFLENKLTNSQARLILYMLERSIRDDRRQATVLSGLNHYTLEHLMPKKWRNHWALGLEADAQERDEAVHMLGNMSLLSSALNSSISDANWGAKKAGQASKHGLNRYAQGLETLAPDLQLDTWDESTIRARGERLAAQALVVWPLP